MATEVPSQPRVPDVATALIFWVFTSVIMGGLSISSHVLDLITRGLAFAPADLVAHGELLLAAMAIWVGAAVRLQSIRSGPTWVRALLFVLCLTGIIASLLWVGDITSTLNAQKALNLQGVAEGSLVVYVTAVVGGAACVLLAETR
jgi:hypothetical protein